VAAFRCADRWRLTVHVLQLHARYRIRAGEDTVVDNEATALRRAGHVVTQLTVDNPTAPVATLGALARSVHNSSSARLVRERVAAVRPDVVHVHNTWFALSSSAVAAAASTGVPVVMTLHNFRIGCVGTGLFRDGAVCTVCVGRSPLPGVLHGCYRGSRVLSALQATEIVVTRRRGVLDSSVTRFIAPSQFMADRLADMGIPSDRLIVKPHFVDDPGPRPDVPSTSGDIVTIGRLAQGKGIETLLAAWSSNPERRFARRLLVIGDGPLARELADDLPDGVEMLGWRDRDEITARLKSARALVMPSELYETFGMVLVEAMSAGLPVIVNTSAGAAAIVEPPPELLVPPRQPLALAAAIEALDDRTVDTVGAANRRRFEQYYSQSVGVVALEAAYREAIAAQVGP
jgi:glycosyltransferase involved in cell wall biosynthesis